MPEILNMHSKVSKTTVRKWCARMFRGQLSKLVYGSHGWDPQEKMKERVWWLSWAEDILWGICWLNLSSTAEAFSHLGVQKFKVIGFFKKCI